MKKVLLLVLLFTITLFNLNAQKTYNTQQKQKKTAIQNQLILKLKSTHRFSISSDKRSLGLSSLDQIAAKQGNYTIRQIGLSTPKTPKKDRPNFQNIIVLKYEHNINIKEAIKEFEASGMVEYAEPNGVMYGSAKIIEDKMAEMGYEAPQLTPNDQYYDAQWWCENNGTFHNNYSVPGDFPNCTSDADIDMEAAWDITTGCSSVVIALLDSGMKMNHPEMAGRIIGGYDFVNNDNNPTDDNGHGSNVGGICFATGNDGGIHAGVNWSSNVLIGKVLGTDGLGLWTDLADAIVWAVDNGADVVNMSIGGQGSPQVLLNAVQYAYSNNVVLVASAGNDNQNTNSYPASYSQVISVGATTCDDSRVNNSSWGSNYHNTVDLVAPGSVIYGLGYNSNGWGYWYGGTSMATPMVAGVASLMLCENPNMTVEDVRSILRSTAEDQVGKSNEDTPGYDIYHGAGRLNAYQALLAVSNCTDNDNDGVCANEDCNDNNPNIPTTPGTICNDDDSSTINDVIQADGCTCAGVPDTGGSSYCVSQGSNSSYEHIENINVANINNTSGDNGGYADFTAQTANVTAGTGYVITLTPGFGNSTIYTEYWKVWIDFNKDGDFEDAGEELLSETSNATITSSISIPASAPSGTTRMRVSMKYNGTPTPCESFQYGEVEDYTVTIGTGGGATCNDGVQNGNETGIDCGGSCPPCSSCNAAVPTASQITNNGSVYCDYAYGYCQGHSGSNKEFELTNLSTGSTSNYTSESHYAYFGNLAQSTNYRYRVRLECGNSGTYGDWSPYQNFTTSSCKLATEILNLNNYPNPFNGRTTIEFSLPNDNPVTLQVYDLTGRRVATLVDDELKIAGPHRVIFNAEAHTSGMYIYKIQAGEYTGTGKMNIIK